MSRRVDRLDDLLGTPCELPDGLEERLLDIPNHASRPARPWLAAAAAALVLAAGALTLHRSSVEPTMSSVTEPRRSDRVVVALRHPSATGRAFLDEEGDRILVTLHRLARDRDPAVAIPAIHRLGGLAREASLPVLTSVLRRADRREAVLEALAAIGSPSAAPAIAPYLADADLRAQARTALLAVGGDDAVVALVTMLDDVEKPAEWVAAIGGMEDAAATRRLLDLLDRPSLEDALLLALGRKHHRLALFDAAGGRSGSRALAALRILEREHPPEAVPALRALLGDASRRPAAARALAAIDTPEAGAALLDGLGAGGVREAFLHAGPGIETWLLERLDGPSRREQHRVVGLLALCGTEHSVPRLRTLAADPALAPVTLEALAGIGGSEAFAALEDLASRSALRRPVVEALAATRSVDAVPVLVRLGQRDRGLRRPVIHALGRIEHPDAVRGILALDGSAATRSTTARTLRAMDPGTVLPTLVALLDGDRAHEARRWLHTVRP